MSLDTGFGFHGFVDDRREQEVFSKLTNKIEESPPPKFATDDDVDGQMEVDDDLKVYNEDMLKMSQSSLKTKKKEGKKRR